MNRYTVCVKYSIVSRIVPTVEANTEEDAIRIAQDILLKILESRAKPDYGPVRIYIDDAFVIRERE